MIRLPLQRHAQTGQALTILLFFMAITLIVTTAAVTLIINSSLGASRFEQSLAAYDLAEAGIENATLRLLRDPAYTGETLTIDSGTATITVTGTNPQTITSAGQFNNFRREIRVVAGFTNGVLAIQSWNEVF